MDAPSSLLLQESPAAYATPAEEAEIVTAGPWWKNFNDPHLDSMITQSYKDNLNVVQAIARVKQARALTRQARSDLFPKIDAQGNIGKEWEGSDAQPSSGSIGGALSWEVDLFGRIQSDATARDYESRARAEDVNAALLSLSGDVAVAYYGAIAAHKQKELLQQQIQTDKELLSLIDLRVKSGIGTNIDQLQQQSTVAETESLIPLTEAQIRVFENRLDVLLGQVPDAQDRTDNANRLSVPDVLPSTGVPLDLLENRPDLRSLKNELVAADADIAQAIADRLPQITLTGSYLYSDTASYSGPLGVLLGSFVQPLLDWGERRAEVKRNKAIYEERLAAYTQAFLEAVEEVENALYQENKQREYIKRLQSRERILEETVGEARARYDEGLDDYTPVLNALQELRAVERNLTIERYQLIQYRIQIYRALGGNIWSTPNI